MSDYDDLGAKLGCPRVQMQPNTIHQLRRLQDQTRTPAGAFEIDSRVVDATGLPTGPAMRRELEFILDTLGLGGFPHAGH